MPQGFITTLTIEQMGLSNSTFISKRDQAHKYTQNYASSLSRKIFFKACHFVVLKMNKLFGFSYNKELFVFLSSMSEKQLFFFEKSMPHRQVLWRLAFYIHFWYTLCHVCCEQKYPFGVSFCFLVVQQLA